MKRPRVILIGHGHLGKWHAQKAFQSEYCDFVGIVDINDSNLEAAKEAYPAIEHVSKLELIENEYDCAIIATPTSYHFELCLQLIEKGKHIFVEKPMTSTIEESREIAQRLRNTNIVFQVGHSERCHKAWEILKKEIQSSRGPAIIQVDRYAPFKGRAIDVDVVQDLMIHDLDILYYLLGEKPLAVSAQGLKMRTLHYDMVEARIEYPGEKHAVITVGRNHTEEIRKLHILNEKGAISVDLMNCEIRRALGSATKNFVEIEKYEKRDHLQIEQDHFYKSIRSGEKVLVPVSDGVEIVRQIDLVLKSIETRQVQGP
ncbi:MAG: Gfo/Idh/MocA family oxidoreductase [Halobacteriovoraceae bacterium]|nr:Gfo/Idh/MocA family oxidoreductase [Halobacteriovoraceae bacterium]